VRKGGKRKKRNGPWEGACNEGDTNVGYVGTWAFK
jgi:hypothetical protein